MIDHRSNLPKKGFNMEKKKFVKVRYKTFNLRKKKLSSHFLYFTRFPPKGCPSENSPKTLPVPVSAEDSVFGRLCSKFGKVLFFKVYPGAVSADCMLRELTGQ